jgi:hypothetical protein
MGRIVSWRFKDTPEDQAVSKAILEAMKHNEREKRDPAGEQLELDLHTIRQEDAPNDAP